MGETEPFWESTPLLNATLKGKKKSNGNFQSIRGWPRGGSGFWVMSTKVTIVVKDTSVTCWESCIDWHWYRNRALDTWACGLDWRPIYAHNTWISRETGMTQQEVQCKAETLQFLLKILVHSPFWAASALPKMPTRSGLGLPWRVSNISCCRWLQSSFFSLNLHPDIAFTPNCTLCRLTEQVPSPRLCKRVIVWLMSSVRDKSGFPTI